MRKTSFIALSIATLALASFPGLARPEPGSDAPEDDQAKPSKPADPVLGPASEYRKKFPEPKDLSTVVDAYRKAQEYAESHARNGASAYVILHNQDGSTGYGRDFYSSGTPNRVYEIRAGYQAIGVGPDVCFSSPPTKPWKCGPQDFLIGIRKLHPDAVATWSHTEQFCETGTCDVYHVIEANTDESSGKLLIALDAEHNYYQLSLILRSDGTPVMATEVQYADGKILGSPADYIYDFTTPVAPIELPNHR